MPPSSTRCIDSFETDSTNGGSTAYSFDFQSANQDSQWDITNTDHEQQVFLLEMNHTTPDNNENRTWSLRIGKGGNIYSFVGPFGEAIPPQTSDNKPWVDEVWQNIVVNTDLNDPSSPYYIHQAGVYETDDVLVEPFFSPTVSVHCETNSCTVASWGQQARIPTTFSSSVLFVSRYTDCGNGVVEHTSIVHNMDDPDDGSSVPLNYLNMPWAGIRTSNLNDILLSGTDGSSSAVSKPIQPYSSSTFYPDLVDTGGYTTFAQSLIDDNKEPFKLPCSDGNLGEVECPEVDKESVQLELTIRKADACVQSASHSNSQGKYTVKCRIHPTVEIKTGCTNCNFIVENSLTGESFQVTGVLHWSWGGVWFYFFPKDNISAEDINAIFAANDGMHVDYPTDGMRYDDNRALAFVHGTDEERQDPQNDEWLKADSRIRYGVASPEDRDSTYFVSQLDIYQINASIVDSRLCVKHMMHYVIRSTA